MGDPAYLQGPDRLGASLRNIPIQAFGWAGAYTISLQLGSGQMPSGFSVEPFTQENSLLRVVKGHMPLQSMPAQGPLMPIQRPTPAVAAAAAVGVLTWDVIYFLAQRINVQL